MSEEKTNKVAKEVTLSIPCNSIGEVTSIYNKYVVKETTIRIAINCDHKTTREKVFIGSVTIVHTIEI